MKVAATVGIVTVSVVTMLGGAQEKETAAPPAVYEQLRAARLHHAGRVHDRTLRVDRFEFQFADGQLFLLDPVAGYVTGAVFIGKGTVRAFPPDAVEHQQLRKLLDADMLEDRFERLVLRFSDASAYRLEALADQGPDQSVASAQQLFDDQREARFKDLLENPDSRIAADLIDQEHLVAPTRQRTPYALALIDGSQRGWFAVEIEPRRIEEVVVSRYDRGFEQNDVWMTCHALTDFDEDHASLDAFAGFPIDPRSVTKRKEDISGIDLGLPLRPVEPSHEGWTAQADVPLVTSDLAIDDRGSVKGTVAMIVSPLRELASLRFRISPWLHVTDVRVRDSPGELALSGEGSEEAFNLLSRGTHELQASTDPEAPVGVIGERVNLIQRRHVRWLTDDWFEPWVTVTLARTIAPSRPVVLEFAYEGKLLEKLLTEGNYLLKDTIFWMPVMPDDRPSRFHMTFRTRERDSVVSSGDLIDDRVEGKTRIVRRLMRTPTLHASFHYGRFNATTTKPDGLPSITVYEDRYRTGIAPGTLDKTMTDLAGALRTGRDYFGEIPFSTLQATETPSTSGQAFPGFLLLSSLAFGELHTGESELFRSHEVGHQWWGVAVNWRDYRDQWLSEGFAQYGAALYVLAGIKDETQFRDIITAWHYDVTNQINVGQGNGRHYGFRPAVIRKSKGSASGPLVVGYRLRTTRTPYDYRLIVYEKGAFILHMLRTMLLEPETGDDTRFRTLMRQFADEQMHRRATTRDFESAVSEAMGESMAWFFDQWVYGVEVPTYRPDLRVVASNGSTPYRLTGTIVQSGVRPSFRMPVPIAFRFGARRPLLHFVWVDKDSVSVDIPLAAKPTEVEFNYLNGVLAKVR